MNSSLKIIVGVVAVSAVVHIFAAGLWIGSDMAKSHTEMQATTEAKIQTKTEQQSAHEPSDEQAEQIDGQTQVANTGAEHDVTAPLIEQLRMRRQDIAEAHHEIERGLMVVVSQIRGPELDFEAIEQSLTRVRDARMRMLSLLDSMMLDSLPHMTDQQRHRTMEQLVHRTLPRPAKRPNTPKIHLRIQRSTGVRPQPAEQPRQPRPITQ